MRLRRVAVLLALIGCAKSAPTAVTRQPVDLAGIWTGALFTTGHGTGVLTLSVTQHVVFLTPSGGRELDLGGSWLTSFSNAAANDSGTVSGGGTDLSDGVDLTLTDSDGCKYALTGTRTGASSMTGTFTARSCALADSGTYGVSKE